MSSAQIIAGRHDALVPPSNAEFLHARLRHSKLDILETGHFTWEDGADDYLALTSSWIQAHSRASATPRRFLSWGRHR
jgi:pimeloyl-ACP methyl ester carboxylesterase